MTGARPGYRKASRTSAKTAKVLKLLKVGTPTISGTARVGSKVTAKTGSWSAKTKFSYQWLRNGKKIKQATKASYQLTTADSSKKLSVKVTGKRKGYATASKASKPVAVSLATLRSSTPTITGTAAPGKTLTASPGSWTSGTSLTYQWLAGGATITGATGRTYQVTITDLGRVISVRVTGSKPGYAAVTKTSAGTAIGRIPEPFPSNSWQAVGHTSGSDIAPGVYTATTQGQWCAWVISDRRRAQDFTDANFNDPAFFEDASILDAGSFHEGGRSLVDLRAGDHFWSRDCGTWSPDGQLHEQPATSFTDGEHTVGRSIKPGTYISQGGSACMWWRVKNVGGTRLSGLDDPDREDPYFWDTAGSSPEVLGMGPGSWNSQTIVTISPTDPYFFSRGCDRWEPLPKHGQPATSFGDGDYAVGTHIEPGRYRQTARFNDCTIIAASGFDGTMDEIRYLRTYSYDDPNAEIEVLATDVRVTSSNCGTWQKVG